MAIPGALRYDLTKYRKRSKLTLDRLGVGVPYATYRRSRRYVSGMPFKVSSQSFHHDLYMPNNPHEYRPNLNAPAAQSNDYYPNKDWESHQISRPTDQRLLRPFPELPVVEEILNYEESRTASEFFLKVMETKYQSFNDSMEIPTLSDIWKEYTDVSDIAMPAETELTPEDVIHKFNDITDALGHLQEVLPPEHPDILNLRAAMHDILDNPETMSKLESFAPDTGPSRFGGKNPYENDDVILESGEPAFIESDLEQIVENEQTDYNSSLGIAENSMMAEDPFQQEGGLQEDSAPYEINQAIDEVQQDPWQVQYDPFNQMMQPQYMTDPFGMPGMMGPMPGP